MVHITLISGAHAVKSTGASRSSGVRLSGYGGVYFYATGGSQLPLGRYSSVFRVRATGANYSYLKYSIYNTADSTFCNEDNAWKYDVVRTGQGWVYKSATMDLGSADNGNPIAFRVYSSAAKNSGCDIDYYLYLPICRPSGDWPQDLAHNALRDYSRTYGLYRR